ncbi:MAG TPA: rod shape-determining protein MreD [Candidatus Hydrogenedentes bacterium]|nr:rod shape-determining protein MreD [Candidatus Hydrogenedentota bacterium]HPG66292.1 rod shape-determining protein MreD [Candidatus Hydrogenedentota bacterium]
MWYNALWLVVVIIAAIFQTTWLEAAKVQGVMPDLTLLLVVYFAIADGEERAMYTGLIGGVYEDMAGKVVLGHHILCNVVVAYVVGRVATRLITEHPAVKVGLVFCASLAQGTMFTAILAVQTPDVQALYTLGTSVVPTAFYTALITPFVFFGLARFFHREAVLQGDIP